MATCRSTATTAREAPRGTAGGEAHLESRSGHGLSDGLSRGLSADTDDTDDPSAPLGDGRGGTGVRSLPLVRRIEALGFRAWPAAQAVYDGSWLVRLTAGHPSRRLNSVNALDRMDGGDIEARVERLALRFASYDRPLTFRQTPLAPPALTEWLDARAWPAEGETAVLTAEIAGIDLSGEVDRLSLKDVGRFVDAAIAVRPRDRHFKSGLTEVLSSIRPEKGLFVIAEGERPVATALCVHDGDFAGVFEVASHPARRGRGLGRTVTRDALRWAATRGAEHAWLQVETDNAAALGLYRSLGFTEAYRYHYRVPPEGDPLLEISEELI